MDIVIVGIDLGKNSCSLAGLDASGRVVLRRRMRRSAVGSFVTSLPRCVHRDQLGSAVPVCFGVQL
jgi:transposase